MMEPIFILPGIIFLGVLFGGFLIKWVSYNWASGMLEAKRNFLVKWKIKEN